MNEMRLRIRAGIAMLGLLLTTCRHQEHGATAAHALPGRVAAQKDPVAAVNALADALLAELRATSAYVRLQTGQRINEFDAISFERAQDKATFSRQMLARLDAIPLDELAHQPRLLAQLLRRRFVTDSSAEQGYWFAFAVTPYAGVMSLGIDHQILAAQALKSPTDRAHYLQLLDSYATKLEQVAAKTRAQATRGIRVPKPAIPGVVSAFRGLHASGTTVFVPTPARLAGVPDDQAAGFTAAVEQRLTARILPGYEAIAGIFDTAYTRRAPNEVGLGRYPGGREHYRRLITDYTGRTPTPQQIYDLGKQRVAELERRMQAIREQLGFVGTREAFHERLRKDPRFLARSPADVETRYLAYVARMERVVPQYFSTLPKAPYGMRRLAPAEEKGVTYGHYELPTPPAEPAGYYEYNGSDLDKRSLINAAHLSLHELIPGHHLQLALQVENPRGHPVRKFLIDGAFVEGWAEYAASLGEEAGLYSDLYDLYGHLLMQALFAARLVVDAGMNYFDMSLAQARAYMKAHTFESDMQIATETLRYSTDYFAQALSYRLGYEMFWALRRRAERALGTRFDIREFHAAAVGEGSMPLDVLEEHIAWFIAQRQR